MCMCRMRCADKQMGVILKLQGNRTYRRPFGSISLLNDRQKRQLIDHTEIIDLFVELQLIGLLQVTIKLLAR